MQSSVRASQETHYVSATKPNRLMLFREIIAVYCENHTEHIIALKVPRQCPLVLLIEVRLREHKALGSEEGMVLGSEWTSL
jgi:hypothetical protein